MPLDAADHEAWYSEGLRFQCTQCGNCCTGPPGFVWVTEEEMSALAAHMGLSPSEFRQRHARRIHGRWSLKEVLTEHGHDCAFLDRKSVPGRAVCGIYKVRPAQCRTWPFWPVNLRSPGAWHRTKRQTPCPGMDTGPLIRLSQIRIQRDRTPD